MDGYPSLRHRAGQAIVPPRHDGIIAPQLDSGVRGCRQIIRCSETPWHGPEFTHHEVADDQSRPIEIPVVAQFALISFGVIEQSFNIVREATGRARGRIFAYVRYLDALNAEAAEPTPN